MHGRGWETMPWMGWGGWLGMVLFWVVIILVIVLLVRRLGGGNSGSPRAGGANNALEILKDRYARGEIDRDEFQQKKKDLE